MTEKLDTVIARMEAFLCDYCAFSDPSTALVVTLWCVGSWCYRQFDAFPYLVITATTKQAGKTRLSELMAFLSFNAKQSTAMTPAVMFSLLDAFARDDNPNAGVTLFYDEAESLSSEAQSMFRQVLNAGYRRGQTIMRKVKDTIKEYPVFCPKVFILIGDVFDTLRDRSIVVELRRGQPRKAFDWSMAESEATDITAALQRAIKGLVFDAQRVPFLQGREAEIWAPLFAIARKAGIESRLTRVASDMSALKVAREDAPKRKLDVAAESDARAHSYAEQALRDLLSVMGGHARLLTDAAVERMRAIEASPWRVYKGIGLDARSLGALVRRFGLQPRNIKIAPDRGKHRGGVVRKGYYADDVRAAVATLGKR